MRKIFISSDHAGFKLKEAIKVYLSKKKLTFQDLGPHNNDRVDYPDYAHKVAKEVSEGKVDFGILLCGSGNGINMSANKHKEIRSALCWKKEIALLARLHNNANILTMPARFISYEQAQEITNIFLTTEFEGGRHQKRVNKIAII